MAYYNTTSTTDDPVWGQQTTNISSSSVIPDSIWILSEDVMVYFRGINFSINFFVDVIGIITNIINIIVFWRVGFKESTVNLSLFALAFSDLGACFFLTWMSVAMVPWVRQLDLPFESDEVSYILTAWPHVAFTKITTLITAFITFERCLCVAMPLSVKTLFTPTRVKAALVFFYVFVAAVMAPFFYANQLGPKFYPGLNKTMVGLIFVKDRVAIETVVYPIINAFLSVFAFFFIAVCTIVLVFNLRKKSKWRRTATTTTTTKTTANETSTKEQKISKMVVIISTLFIVCFFPTVAVQMVMMLDRRMNVDGEYSNLIKTLASYTFMCEAVNSTMNVVVYYYNSSIYKAAFDEIFRSKNNSNNKNKKRQITNE